MLLTVKLFFRDGTTDIKECWDINDISLVGVSRIEVLRKEAV